ncbi:MAG: two-component system histidine kinase PnpS [Nitrospirales bacterium]
MNRPLVLKFSIMFVGLMAVGIALGYFLAMMTMSFLMVILSVCGLFAVFFGVALWLMNKVLVPVREAQSVADELVSLYGPREQVWKTGDDLEELRRTLTHLSSHVRERIHILEGERAKVTTILDSMVEGVMALDAQGRIVVINPSARRILDLADKQVERRPLLEIVRNRELADFVEWCQGLTSSERCGREVVLTMPQRRVLEVNAMPLALIDQQRGLVLVLHDITELRRLEQVRAEFVANVSHELRTPLTAIKGYLETLLDESSPDPVMYRRFLSVAHTHADRLGRLVNDLMNLSDIETGKIKLNYESVALAEVVNEVAGIYQNEAEKKGVTFDNRIPFSIHVQADRDRLSQILINLVDNAVKYTAVSGEICFSAVMRENNEQIVLRVQDSGQGIPPVDLPRITERFYRVDKARSREDGGTGLGLAIVKHLVHLHQGSIHINSEVGKGTTVEITLPIPLSNPTS